MASNVIQQNRLRNFQNRHNFPQQQNAQPIRLCHRPHNFREYDFRLPPRRFKKKHDKNTPKIAPKNAPKNPIQKIRAPKPKPNSILSKIKKLSFTHNLRLWSAKVMELTTVSLLFRFLLLMTYGSTINGEGNVGCNFMRTLCIPGSEVCFDDDIFGKCIPTAGVDVEDIDRTPLTEEQSEKLATILLELQGAGLGWDHPYVQCRIQGQLYSLQKHMQLPPNLCANLAPIPSENDRNGDMAYVRFIPPLEDYADANDETDHNLLYYPPMKKQASVDTIFHELQQQENQRQRQFQSSQMPRQTNSLDFLQYGGFDDRTFRQPNHSPNYFNPFMDNNDRVHLSQARKFTNSDINQARKKLHRLLSDYDLDQASPDSSYMIPLDRSIAESDIPLFNPEELEQPPEFDNSYFPRAKFRNADEREALEANLELSKSFHRLVPQYGLNRDFSDNFNYGQNKRHNDYNPFSGLQSPQYEDNRPPFNYDMDIAKQKFAKLLSEPYVELETPERRYLDSIQKSPPDENIQFINDLYREPSFNGYEDFSNYGSPKSMDNFVPPKEMDNRAPPREEPTHRSFFRELASEQGLEQAPLLEHEDPNVQFVKPQHQSFPSNEDKEDEHFDRYIYGSSLTRNSLKPFEEEAILSSAPYMHKMKHQKVDKLYTEGGLVLVPQNNYQSDPGFNSYDNNDNYANDESDDDDSDKEKAREFLADVLGFTRHERLDVKKPGPLVGPPEPINSLVTNKNSTSKSDTKEVLPSHIKGSNEAHKKKKVMKEVHSAEDHAPHSVDTEYVHVYVKNPIKYWVDGERIVNELAGIMHMQTYFNYLNVQGNGVSFRVNSTNPEHKTAFDVAKNINDNQRVKNNILRRLGFTVLGAGVGDKIKETDDSGISAITQYSPADTGLTLALLAICCILLAATIALIILLCHRKQVREKLNLLRKGSVVTGIESCSKDYQDLCRARMAGKGNNAAEPASSGRIMTLSKEHEKPPSSRSSTSSWCEEPALTNMDISTGHMVLSYMEDHLRNKGRLQREWEALCRYEAEPSARDAAQQAQCASFNRPGAPLPYDHSRVVLNHLANAEGFDYINASSITDHDPRAPAYVAAQGPLPATLAHFWQMIWEQGAVVIVSLCRLQENGEIACARYWPEEGAEVYHIYEVHLVSEHIWCDDYLVRSFYLKNLRTSETRTVTQFHFLSWPPNGVPGQAKALLDFRRKVNKSYRGRSCPIVVHGSTGAGRTGAYILLDLVLGRMNKGAREIDIAATLEHLRDQRAGLVATRQQFEFVLMAVAEEVHAILKALPANQSNEKKDVDSKEATNGAHSNGSNGSASNNGTNVAGGVLKEEDSENTEEEASNGTTKAKENSAQNEKKEIKHQSAATASTSAAASAASSATAPATGAANATKPTKVATPAKNSNTGAQKKK